MSEDAVEEATVSDDVVMRKSFHGPIDTYIPLNDLREPQSSHMTLINLTSNHAVKPCGPHQGPFFRLPDVVLKRTSSRNDTRECLAIFFEDEHILSDKLP